MLPYLDRHLLEAGCDEAGRGCLAGPVFAAAVILPTDFFHPLLNDSKQLTENQRFALRPIIEKEAVAWAVAEVSPKEIDEINILWASILAMHRALDQLKIRPEQLLIDGNRFRKYGAIPHQCIVKGDSKFAAIAAASILAKTWRDERTDARIARPIPPFQLEKKYGLPDPCPPRRPARTWADDASSNDISAAAGAAIGAFLSAFFISPSGRNDRNQCPITSLPARPSACQK